jgi:hypothetical protein
LNQPSVTAKLLVYSPVPTPSAPQQSKTPTMKTPFLLLSVLLSFYAYSFAFSQKHVIYTLKNSQKEDRIATYHGQYKFFWNWVWKPQYSFRDQKVLQFSESFKPDTVYIRQKVEKIRKTLPNDFWNPVNFYGDMFDHEPQEAGIWFINTFIRQEKYGGLKVYAAYKVTFEGNDARVDATRHSPKIKGIEFIYDKPRLAEYEKQIKSWIKAGACIDGILKCDEPSGYSR